MSGFDWRSSIGHSPFLDSTAVPVQELPDGYIIDILFGPRMLPGVLPPPRELRHPLPQLDEHQESFVFSRLSRRQLVRSLGLAARIGLVHELLFFLGQAVTQWFSLCHKSPRTTPSFPRRRRGGSRPSPKRQCLALAHRHTAGAGANDDR